MRAQSKAGIAACPKEIGFDSAAAQTRLLALIAALLALIAAVLLIAR